MDDVFRRSFGGVQVTALLDGGLAMPLGEVFDTADAASAAAIAAAAGESLPVRSPVNAYLLELGPRRVLVDTGAGGLFGPELGLLPRALAAAGVDPARIDAVLMTHLHPDHVGGLAEGAAPRFPNAELVVPDAEAAFWLAPETLAGAPEGMRPFVQAAQAGAAAYGARVRRFAPGTSPLPGIESIALPGHTAGHTGYLVGSAAERLLIWGDIVHNATLQFARPDWTVAFDADAAAAAATRARAFDMAAAERIPVAGMHIAFPGIGHVERRGTGYAFVPLG